MIYRLDISIVTIKIKIDQNMCQNKKNPLMDWCNKCKFITNIRERKTSGLPFNSTNYQIDKITLSITTTTYRPLSSNWSKTI